MPRSATSKRSDNINIRVSRETLGLIDRAARVLGKTRTDFILETVRTAAEDAILDQRLIMIDAEKWEAFCAALDAPAQPNPKLEALLARTPPWEK